MTESDINKLNASDSAKAYLRYALGRIDRTSHSEIMESGSRFAPQERAIALTCWHRMFVDRFREFWDQVAKDSRFPKFDFPPEELLPFAVGDGFPAEGVVLVVYFFSPAEYDDFWIHEQLYDFLEYVPDVYEKRIAAKRRRVLSRKPDEAFL